MEASSEAPRLPVRTNTRDRVRKYIGQYGLIAVLLIMPVTFGLHDLATDGNLTRLGNNLVAGLSNGAIWALIALGYTLVYGIIELINFAHGEVFMIGSLVTAAWFWEVIGLTEATAILALIVGLAGIAGRRDAHQRGPERDDRTGGLPAAPNGAEARAADHGGRHVVHPPERRDPLDRRLAGGCRRSSWTRRRSCSRSAAWSSTRVTSSRSPSRSRWCFCSPPSSTRAAWAAPCARPRRIPRRPG